MRPRRETVSATASWRWGWAPIRLPIEGDAAGEILSVNHLDDYAQMRDRLAALGRPARVAILGAGLADAVLGKTPSCKLALAPPPHGSRGEWVSRLEGERTIARFVDEQGLVRGFGLSLHTPLVAAVASGATAQATSGTGKLYNCPCSPNST